MDDEQKPEPRPKKPSISDLLESHKITHGKLDEMIAAMKSAQTITDDEQVLHSGWRLAKKYPTTALLIIGIVFGPGWADSIIRVVKSLSGSPTPVKVESRVDYEYLMGHPVAGVDGQQIAFGRVEERSQPTVQVTTPGGTSFTVNLDGESHWSRLYSGRGEFGEIGGGGGNSDAVGGVRRAGGFEMPFRPDINRTIY